jgi:hypothetical protein
MSGGWSAHLELASNGLRVRTDFFTRPPRVRPPELARMWRDEEGRDPPFTDALLLAEMKKTAREKDYPFIGELARRMRSPADKLRYSRSVDDLIELAAANPDLARELAAERPVLARVAEGRRALGEALDREMRELIEQDRRRLAAYREASRAWSEDSQSRHEPTDRLPLREAHARIVEAARGVLPEAVTA